MTCSTAQKRMGALRIAHPMSANAACVIGLSHAYSTRPTRNWSEVASTNQRPADASIGVHGRWPAHPPTARPTATNPASTTTHRKAL